jgi:glycosyltransferase involved in cell wall biosynthesis
MATPPPRRSPRVLVLTPSADGYGSDRAMHDVVAAMAGPTEPMGVTVLSAADGPTLDRLRALGVEVHVGPDWALRRRSVRPAALPGTLLRVARSAVLVRRLHRQHRFDVVYVNTVASLLLPVVHPALPRSVAVVVHVREMPRTGNRFNRLFFRAVARVADVVLCNSTATASFVAEAAPSLRDRIEVVHDGVTEIQAATPPCSAGGDAPLEIVCVGRIHPQKGQQVLLDALVAATAAGRSWRVHLWGEALPEHADIRQALEDVVRRHDLDDRVVWHGYGSDTAEMYGGMDVAVVPSTWPEGFSLVTAEGQMAGLPVVATVPGGPADIVVDGETGLLVPLEDAPALRAALERIDDDPVARRAMGAAGRQRALEQFTATRAAQAASAWVRRAATDPPCAT